MKNTPLTILFAARRHWLAILACAYALTWTGLAIFGYSMNGCATNHPKPAVRPAGPTPFVTGNN